MGINTFFTKCYHAMKSVILSNSNPILENITLLEAPRPESFGGFIYLWKCVPEDLYYVGSHKGKPEDEYRGSGARFKKVFEYYGVTKFERVVLEYVDDVSQIKAREQYWMNKFRATKSNRFLNTKNAVARLSI